MCIHSLVILTSTTSTHSFIYTKQTISKTKSTRNVLQNLLGGVGTLLAPVLLKVSSESSSERSETARASPSTELTQGVGDGDAAFDALLALEEEEARKRKGAGDSGEEKSEGKSEGKGEGKGDDGDGGRADPSQVRPIT